MKFFTFRLTFKDIGLLALGTYLLIGAFSTIKSAYEESVRQGPSSGEAALYSAEQNSQARLFSVRVVVDGSEANEL